MAEPTSRGSPPTSVTSDASMATSVPVPMATPRSARASAGRVVDAVADHRDLAAPAWRRSMTAALSPGSTSAMTCSAESPPGARRPPPWRGCRPSPATRPCRRPGGRDRLGGLGLDRVGDRHEARRRATGRDEHHGPAVRGDRFRAARSSAARSMPCSSSSRRLPTSTSIAVDEAAHAAADDRLEPVDLRASPAPSRAPCGTIASPSGCSEPVSSAAARSRTRASSKPVAGDHRRHRRPAQRERAGLVHDHGVDAAGRLERLAATDQDARLGALAGARP